MGNEYYFDTSTGLKRGVLGKCFRINFEGLALGWSDGALQISGWFKTQMAKLGIPTEYSDAVIMGGIDIDGKYYFFDHSNGLVPLVGLRMMVNGLGLKQ